MILAKELLQGYENTELVDYREIDQTNIPLVPYSQLPESDQTGFPKACFYKNGELHQVFSNGDTHVCVIAATGMGKTTGIVDPVIRTFAHMKNPRSMIVADPKGELLRKHYYALKKRGYKVYCVNFRDPLHSEKWNPLTPIYDAYVRACTLEETVELVETPNGYRNRFMDVIYERQEALDLALNQAKAIAIEEVQNQVDELAVKMISTKMSREAYWPESARLMLKAGIWGMLEDIFPTDNIKPITRETFSFNTLLTIFDSMRDGENFDDRGFFTSRPEDSRALRFAGNCVLNLGRITRGCIISELNTALAPYRSSAVRLITSANSFEFDELVDDNKPVALFISYQDELKAHYQVISTLLQSAYNFLIKFANSKPDGKLDTPFYFILDEFGNLPPMPDADVVISACRSRNIFLMLVLQSYAQLDNVYGEQTAKIIRDNLNVHIFLGSNNPETLDLFSKECGEYTRISPKSALSGSTDQIESYILEPVPRMPKSSLAKLAEGECVVTEARCGYVMLSKMERSYMCKEFRCERPFDSKDYLSSVNPLDDKYLYRFQPRNSRSIY